MHPLALHGDASAVRRERLIPELSEPAPIALLLQGCAALPDRWSWGRRFAALFVAGNGQVRTQGDGGPALRRWRVRQQRKHGQKSIQRIEAQAQATGQTLAQVEAAFVARQPMGRLGTPAEIAALAVYLGSDESAFTTGTSQLIDGGWAN